MPGGRKPLAAVDKDRRGNPGNRPVNRAAPTATEGVPECPDYLDGDALDEWNRIVPLLAQSKGLLHTVDAEVIAGYCQCVADLRAAAKHLATDDDYTVEGPHGVKVSPWWQVRQQAMTQLRQYVSEFGLSPSARTRIQLKGEGKTKDENSAAQLRAVRPSA